MVVTNDFTRKGLVKPLGRKHEVSVCLLSLVAGRTVFNTQVVDARSHGATNASTQLTKERVGVNPCLGTLTLDDVHVALQARGYSLANREWLGLLGNILHTLIRLGLVLIHLLVYKLCVLGTGWIHICRGTVRVDAAVHFSQLLLTHLALNTKASHFAGAGRKGSNPSRGHA
jgi:hypothetical protein